MQTRSGSYIKFEISNLKSQIHPACAIGRVFLAVLGWICAAGQAAAATRVDLVLDEPQPPRSVPWPLTTGVPFPKGQLTEASQVRLIDDTGAERLLQAKVAATWDAQRSSIRWLTIDFIAEPGRKYALEFGPDVRAKAPASPLKVAKGEPVRVATGALMAELFQKGPRTLGNLCIDLDGDGKIQPDEVTAVGPADGEHAHVDQDGRRFSSAGDGMARQVVIESSGPVRACVRVDGFYTGPDGQRIVQYRTRYHFFAGLALVKVVDEFRITASTRSQRFRDIAFSLQLPPGKGQRSVAVDASGEPGNQVLSMPWQKETKSVSSFQTVYRHYGNPECTAGIAEVGPAGEKLHKQMEQAGEWMQVADGQSAVNGSLPWFWQQFPKEWEATPNQLRLHLWSPRGGELDFGPDGVRRFIGEAGASYLLDWKGVRAPRTPIEKFFYFAGRAALERGEADGLGTRKHHEFFFHFAPARQAAQGQEYGRLAARPPLALASGKWNCGTDVFGPLMPRPNDAADEAIVDRLFDLSRYAQDNFGDYGWWLFGAGPHYSYQWDPATQRHYADPRRFEYHTYQKETQLWWNYLRSGERRFLDWALPSENHWVDIAVSHEPTRFGSEWRGGEAHKATLHWPRGDWSIDSSMHHLRHHDTGEAWLRGQSQFWASYHRTLETTTLAYFLTGDERLRDVLDYWRAYWSALAGKTSASTDFQPWHREQAWFKPTGPGEKPKTWAEMIRDYAPFTSGSRHQMTLFFNLATLYEFDWDPVAGQVLREYADAFLDPAHPIGVWRSQDNRLPARAEAPTLAHYWTPALWKYGRATGDPRMKEILAKFFDACLGADPFESDVGIYSNAHIGWAWYFTRDPRHLRPAVIELERLRPFAAPLAKPEDLGQRLYNPYAPIHAFAAVPRLLWALDDAKRQGIDIPPSAVARPQRTAIAFMKAVGKPVELTLWGFDAAPRLLGPDGKPFKDLQVQSRTYASATQPFDRTLPQFEAYRHRVTIPRLELGVLELTGADGVACNAAAPLAVEPGESWLWKVPAVAREVRLESAKAKAIRVLGPDGKPRPGKVAAATVTVPVAPEEAGQLWRLENAGPDLLWLRIADVPVEQCWVAASETALRQLPGSAVTAAALPPAIAFRADEEYPAGRFGQGVLVVPGRPLRLPDHIEKDGQTVRLFDLEQGTVEFWVKRLWDERLAPAPARVTFLTNGLVEAWSPWKLPVGEWAHVAVVWRPLQRDPNQTMVHIYVNGLDQANYRSTWWEGYSVRPYSLPTNGKWLKEWLAQAPAGTAFVLDELRISKVPRYADLKIDFGGQQTFNPVRFTPPAAAFRPDGDTTALFHFDGDSKEAARGNGP
jgi:hypothetical protein